MFSKSYGVGLHGVEAFVVSCEVDVGRGLPQSILIGQLASSVREAQDRVRTAIKNSGFMLEPRKIVINFSPAYIKKEGSYYDLAMSVAILASYGMLSAEDIGSAVFVGELSLDGSILPVRGVLSMTLAAKHAGFKSIYLAKENVKEASVIEGIDCYGVDSLSMLIACLKKELIIESQKYVDVECEFQEEADFSDICGQDLLKRASIIAVSGMHNILFIGAAGSGKTMIASRLASIMPSMSLDERIEVSKLYSLCGLLDLERPLLNKRPFRAPHHSISCKALSGGGIYPKPGEISLAHRGVLFLDELTEFKKDTLELLRQPMETGRISISRLQGVYNFPAAFLLCAACNPCKCGFYPDRSKCNCDEAAVRAYLGRISKPLLDRIDICVESTQLSYDELRHRDRAKSSACIREDIERVIEIQRKRFSSHNINYNSEMSKKHIDIFCKLDSEGERLLKRLYESMDMSDRALHKTLKLARSIADYEGYENIRYEHLCEAVAYRQVQAKYWRRS